ncbi:MAG: BtrH N-terminal domain-containing protein, partial [Ignavibacteriales bacterium]|nr:BtrH N-terminal domain-containing protein [Ignavibacteriales bacterium]
MKHIVKNFTALGGHHCISTAYKQVFHHLGHKFSEEMIFGLASALNFFYFDFKVMPFPMIGGRNKIGEFEDNLEKHTNIKVTIHKTSSIKKAREELYKLIQNNIPVPLYVDMAYLGYLHLPKGAHFGGHAIVVFGIDEEKGIAYVSDRDTKDIKITLSQDEKPADFHEIKLSDLEKARSSKHKPFPAENKWITFDFSNIKKLDKYSILTAIKKNTEQFLSPKIKNLGINGINLFARSIKNCKNFHDEKLNLAAFNAFIMINQIGGTGGGCFRQMYGNFLIEAAGIVIRKKQELILLGNKYIELSVDWDKIGDKFLKIAKTLDRDILNEIETELEVIAKLEEKNMKALLQIANNV